ncbi:hypothetical protein ABI59_08055 [Acidobacteria bacterium Mor1]|nr:hypothetical protein ABI59_08055 [Acidobacteria bacterium Mor1]
MNKTPMPPEMFRHYALGLEAGRLEARGNLERERTESILRRYLPAPPAELYDVGGGTGIYAFSLAAKGYTVHLLDVVPDHIEQARRRAAGGKDAGDTNAANAPATMEVGDARALPRADASVDAVLLLGPLYHLTERADRIAALTEARRVLRPGGLVLAAGISRFASMLDGMARSLLDDPQFRTIVDGDLIDGQHRNPGEHPEYFTTTFFHHPRELSEELADSGFEGADVLAVEGPAWLLPRLQESGDTEARERWMALLERTEKEPSLLGASAHLMGIGRKP